VLAAHTASFLNLINTALEDISRGVASPHHFHNVRCGIENILSLLKYNNEVVEKADQLSRRAYDYVTYHDLVTSKIVIGRVARTLTACELFARRLPVFALR
jgi:hypothetical protein